MIMTAPTARHRAAIEAAHKARANAFGDLTRRLFVPARSPDTDTI
ncbi:MAG: hypothetical protein AAGB05_06140 [Pseudomonadota bacterium]